MYTHVSSRFSFLESSALFSKFEETSLFKEMVTSVF